MRKRKERKKLSRTSDQRKALLKSLFTGLFSKKQVTTTLAKAKFLKPQAEKLITHVIDASNDPIKKISKIRIIREYVCQKACDELFKSAQFCKNRKGGYLRIIKLPKRSSDFSEMAKVEWVDEVLVKKTEAKKAEKVKKSKK